MIFIISVVATVLSLFGNYLVNIQNKKGFIVWSIANILWIYIAIYTPNYPQCFMFIIYCLFNIQGYIFWKKKERDIK